MRQIIVVFIFLFFYFSHDCLYAQNGQYVDLWGGAGWSSIFNDIEKNKTVGGIGFDFGLGYQMDINNFMLLGGVEFMSLNSKSKLQEYIATYNFPYNDGVLSHNIIYNYQLLDYKERYSIGYFNIPLFAGLKFNRYYALLGAKIGLNLFGSYKNGGNLSITASDPKYIDPLENVGHGTLIQGLNGNGSLNFGLNITPAVEFGIYLDEWLPESMTELNNSRRTNLSYRAGIFVDYGLSNLNKSSTDTKLISEPKGNDLTGEYMSDVNVNYLAGSELAGNKTFNSILAGVKLTVQFDVTKQKAKPRTKPSQQIAFPVYVHVFDATTNKDLSADVLLRYSSGGSVVLKQKTNTTGVVSNEKVRRGRYVVSVSSDGYKPYKQNITHSKADTLSIGLLPIPNFVVHVFDAETEQGLFAEVIINNVSNQKEELKKETDTASGLLSTQLGAGKYQINVISEGYIYYQNIIDYSSLGDTVQVALQPIKKDVKVIIHNVFFELNRAEMKPESELALIDLHQFLVKNPDVKIHIIGHTDNTGSASYNMELSKNRAKAIYDSIAKRGIDLSRLSYEGKGASEPVATNETEEGRAANRRVEFIVK